MGYTHCCIEDIGILRSIPNITIISPADSFEVVKSLEASFKNDQAVYVPSSKSDLYIKDQFKQSVNKQHNLLTPINNFNKKDPNTLKLGGNLFHNHTRQDLKNVKC